jgi:hypothetical protein
LVEKKFQTNGLGITFEDVMQEFGINKKKAQRTLKYLYSKKFLFTAQYLIDEVIRFNGIKRENPQRYYLTSLKPKIIEGRKNNVQLDTTGTTVHSPNPLEAQKIQYLSDWLIKLSDMMLYIHKLQLKVSVDKENYSLINLSKSGNDKVHQERIGKVRCHHNVEYRLHKNGTIMIYVTCSDNPFRLHDEQDISNIMVFLGRVEDRLRRILADTRDEVVQPVRNWILTGCDINKDIEINGLAQITLPDIQISTAEKIFRAYVNLVNEKAYYRNEASLTPNKPIHTALNELKDNTDLDKEI